jgi:monofunctional biosynthetic peptidoglycan transglycosylase
MVFKLTLAGALAVGVIALVLRYYGPPGTLVMLERKLQGESIDYRPVRLDGISENLVLAVIAAEDTKFCDHIGFDFEAIEMALEDAAEGKRQRGASTLSQQTAKNVFLWNGGGWFRKGLEVPFTLVIEGAWPKARTLEVYLNIAEWGDGIFGAEAAAQRRFNKSAKDLTRREAALLAAVLPSPNKWRVDPPGRYVSRRTETLIKRMEVVKREKLAECVLDPEAFAARQAEKRAKEKAAKEKEQAAKAKEKP